MQACFGSCCGFLAFVTSFVQFVIRCADVTIVVTRIVVARRADVTIVIEGIIFGWCTNMAALVVGIIIARHAKVEKLVAGFWPCAKMITCHRHFVRQLRHLSRNCFSHLLKWWHGATILRDNCWICPWNLSTCWIADVTVVVVRTVFLTCVNEDVAPQFPVTTTPPVTRTILHTCSNADVGP